MTRVPRITIIGEAMLELSGAGEAFVLGDSVRLGQGGDTLNTAIGLARQGCQVDFITALGRDAWSDAMIAAWQAEGVGTDHVLRHPERRPGLYAIRTDAAGERAFDYWRDQSAAREMFSLPGMDAALAGAATADLLYLSGITLSILPEAARLRLIRLAGAVRQAGGRVAFDPNYRPTGWSGPAEARTAFDAFAAVTDLALPTRSDEDMLHPGLGIADHFARWRGLGVASVVLKDGANGCHVGLGGEAPVHHPAHPPIAVIDTTGAGDAFNAGLLGALTVGAEISAAIKAGSRLASHTIAHPGAIPPHAGSGSFISQQEHVS
ncbi:sugar kinase [Maricaulis sp.]|uniref:sugar kinase n=1 Tax=Maricaulis sp. TaxID=1486257 RepID=UPI0025C07663|nr:sugar kinase [Maricaulis sp.]